MSIKWVISFLIVLVLLSEVSSVSASPPARIVAGIITNVVTTLFKWLWSLTSSAIKTTEKVHVTTRSLMKFEAGYTLETVFDGSRIGIEPHSVVASATGELLILDSGQSSLYKVSTPLSRYSRPKIIAGSPEGSTGHVDGKLRDARMYHPKGITVDDSGNIYIADTMNMAIRKISDSGISTIAGGKWNHGGGYIDGANEDANLSDDFDVVYVRSSCSLLITDRGNQAIHEIQLHDGDCSNEQPVEQNEQQEESLHLGVAVLVAAVFFGYMLALLKQRVQALFSTKKDPRPQFPNHAITAPYQRPLRSVRPPLIPPEDEDESYDQEDEGILYSFGRLLVNASSSVAEVFAGLLFSGFRRKKTRLQNPRHFQQLNRHASHGWPAQDSYFIRDADEPPGLESRTPVLRKPYPLMDKPQQEARQSPRYYDAEDSKPSQHQGQLPQQQQQQQEHQEQRHVSSNAKSSSEKSSDKSEIVFGAVQEQDGRREAMVIKAVDYSDPAYSHHNIRPRINYMGYSAYSYG